MNRHEMREQLVFSVYQHILLKRDLFAQAEENLGGALEEEDRLYASDILNDLEENEEGYIQEIDRHLVDWSFERLNYVDQGILLVAASELKLGRLQKAIVVDEAVQIAKKYCDDDAYRYINGVLDNL